MRRVQWICDGCGLTVHESEEIPEGWIKDEWSELDLCDRCQQLLMRKNFHLEAIRWRRNRILDLFDKR